jgi:hypothetical protein
VGGLDSVVHWLVTVIVDGVEEPVSDQATFERESHQPAVHDQADGTGISIWTSARARCRHQKSQGSEFVGPDALLLSEQMVSNIVISKLDEETQKAFQVTQKPNDLPKWEATLEFLQGGSHALGTLELTRPSISKSNPNKSFGTEKSANNRSHTLLVTTNESIVCPLCQENHFLNQCWKFRQMTVSNRLETAVKYGICTNCLRAPHSPKDWSIWRKSIAVEKV